jgi:acetyltransferase-like isoleucine patch superfamily enzyme
MEILSVIKKYVIVLISLTRLIFIKYFLRLDINFHYLQSHSLFSKIKARKTGKLIFEKNTQISSGCEIFLGEGALIKIGERSYFNKRCIISAHYEVIIGNNCLFGPDVKIYDNNHVFEKGKGIIHGKHKVNSVKIGDNCWVASNVVILPGTCIGNNCVIGAGVILKGNVPDNSLVRPNTKNIIQSIR